MCTSFTLLYMVTVLYCNYATCVGYISSIAVANQLEAANRHNAYTCSSALKSKIIVANKDNTTTAYLKETKVFIV